MLTLFQRGLTMSLLVTAPLTAQDAITALGRAEQTYAGLEALTAEFVQTIVNPMLGGPEVSSGVLFIAPPSRFSMRFSEPEGDRIVADGTWLWAYTPSTVPGQVIRTAIPAAGAASPNLLAQFVVRPLEHYRVSHVGVDSSQQVVADVVRLIPRSDEVQFREAEISIARGTGFILRLSVRELSGQRRTLEFSEISVGAPIPIDELGFAVPEGVRVVTPY
jgi:outer membrane lipoprotein carrier protein